MGRSTHALTKLSSLSADDVLTVDLDPANAAVAETKRGIKAGDLLGTGLTSAESAAGLTKADIDVRYEPSDIRRYYAKVDGETDDSTAWTKAVSIGGRITMPAGSSILKSASFNTLSLIADTTIEGVGKDLSIISLTGTTERRMFSAIDVNNIEFRGLTIRGNNQASSYISANAIYISQTGSSIIEGFLIENCRFENFKSDAWVCFHNNGGTAAIQDIRVQNCTFQSESGNARGPTNIAIPSGCVWFEGEESNTTGIIKDFWVTDCWMDCEHTKTGIWVWDNCNRGKLTGNVIINAGLDSAFNDDKASYAIGVYDNSAGAGANPPTDIEIAGGTIATPRDCGVYNAGPFDVRIHDVRIVNQSSSADTTLPKGAIAFNGGYGKVSNCILTNNQFGIAGAPKTGESLVISGCKIDDTKTSGAAIKSKPGGNSANSGRLVIDGVDAVTTVASTRGLFVQTTNSGFSLEQLVVRSSQFSATTNDIQLTKTAGNVDIDETIIDNVVLEGSGLNFSMTTNDNPVHISNMTIVSGADSNAFDVRSSDRLNINGLVLRDKTSGSNPMLNMTGAEGTLQGVVFNNVTTGQRFTATGGNEMGSEVPTWTGDEGDFVQNINVATEDASNMLLYGWMHDGTSWFPLYLSTVTPAT